MAEKLIRTIVGYSLDKQSIVTIVQGTEQVNTVLMKTVGITEQLQTVSQRPLVGLIQYSKDIGLFNKEIIAANESIVTEREELEQLKQATDQAAAATDGLAKATDRARDARGRFLPKGSVGVIPSAGGGGSAPADPLGIGGADFGGGDTGGGGVGGLGQRITRFSSAARLAIPAIPLGGGLSSEAIFNLGRLGGALVGLAEKVPLVTTVTEALTPVLGATAAGFTAVAIPIALVAAAAIPLGLAVKSVSDELERSRKAYADELIALKEATDFKNQNIVDARTRSAEENRQEAADQNQRIQNQEQFLTELRRRKEENDRAFADLGASFNPAERKRLADRGAELDKQIEEASNSLIKLGTEFQNTVVVLGPQIDAREKEQQAIEAANKATNDRATIITQNAATEAKVAAEIRTLTKDQVNARLEAIKDERDNIVRQIDALSALPNRTGEVTEKLKNLGTQMEALDQESQGLLAAIGNLPAEIKRAAEAAEKIRQDQIAATKKYNDSIVKLDNDKGEAEVDAADTYLDRITDISQKAVDDSAKILADLQEKQSGLQTKLDRDLASDAEKHRFSQLQDQIKFQRSEVEAESESQQRIQEIRTKAKQDEFSDQLDRNFASIAQKRRDAANAVAAEAQQATNDKQQRLKRYQDQQTDDDAAFTFQREQKIKQEQIALADAQTAANKAYAAAEDNRRKQLDLAQRAYNDEITQINNRYTAQRNLLNQQITAELQQIAAGNAAKLQLDAQYYAQSQQLIKGIYGGNLTAKPVTPVTGTGSNVTPRIVATRAFGGPLNQNQPAIVNEPWSSGRETFTNSGGQTVALPGFGMFLPFTSGQVSTNSNNRSVNLSMPIYIEGVQVDAVMAKVGQLADDRIAYTLERLNQRTP